MPAGSTPRQNLDVGVSHEVSPTRASAHLLLLGGRQPLTTVRQLLRDVLRHNKHGEFPQGDPLPLQRNTVEYLGNAIITAIDDGICLVLAHRQRQW